MILSVSRRTDIPAFYSTWFFNRIEEGYVSLRNPFNSNQVKTIYLKPDLVDCIVFWTKNPEKMLLRLDELKHFNYYFQFTLTSYDKTMEPFVPRKKHLINTFINLSNMIGKNRVVWRYDPIILTDKFTIEYHFKWFDYLASKLSRYTKRCVISFLDVYDKTKKNLANVKLDDLTQQKVEIIADGLSKIASKYDLMIETCSEDVDLSKYGINYGRCIDNRIISEITGKKFTAIKDKNQRKECGCIKSVDIGAYNTCLHGCLYCYANFSRKRVEENVNMHSDYSPFLIK